MKKFLATLMVFSMMLALYPQSVSANTHEEPHVCMVVCGDEVQPAANYGVTCIVCDRDDCMQYMFTEQVGIGGTMYIMYYLCTNCNGLTTVTLHAR